MSRFSGRISVSFLLFSLLALGLSTRALSQESPYFTPGNLIVTVEGCGVHGGTCTSVPNGTGTGSDNSSAGGYGDNQAAPLTLFQYQPSGTSSATYVDSLVFPQIGSGANLPVSGEYGSSSEGSIQLSGNGQYLTLMGYGINAATFDAAYFPIPGFSGDPYGAAPSGALAQSGSLTGQSYTPVARVLALIDAYGNVNSATALYNVFNTNNPRSAYTVDGISSFYVSGQGSGCDETGGVFLSPIGAPNTAPTAITGSDANGTSTCIGSGGPATIAQDTRFVQIYNGTLYVSVDSTEGKSFNRSMIGSLGDPPSPGLFTPGTPNPYVTGPFQITGYGNSGGTGKETITTGANSNGNSFNAGLGINLSPASYFFASPSVLYVADTGSPKQTSANSLIGDGGLQKWVNSATNGSGTWSLKYTLYKGLNLVENTAANSSNTAGTTGLLGLAGQIVGGNVYLYATGYTIGDLDPSYLFGITDTLSTTTNPGTTFTVLDTAPQDSNFKSVSLAPILLPGSATITSSPSGLAFTSSGSGCAPGTYTTPVTLQWTSGNTCELTVASPQSANGGQYILNQWQDGTTTTTDTVQAPANSAVYNASFSLAYQLTTSAGTGGTVSAGGYFAAGSTATITATPNAGYYFVNFTGSTTSTSNPLTLTMNGPQSITANFAPQVTPAITWPTASTITYGQTLGASVLNGGSATNGSSTVQGTFTFVAPATIPAAGTAAESVVFTPNNTTEYLTVTGNVNVPVSQAALTIAVQNATDVYGTPLPTFTSVLTGLVNGDSSSDAKGVTSPLTVQRHGNVAVVGDLTVNYTTTALTAAPWSDVNAFGYPINATLVGPAAGNYLVTVVPGTLTITQAAQTIPWADPVGQTANTPLALTTTASSGLPVSYVTFTPAICTISTDGSGNPIALMLAYGNCSLRAQQAGNIDYSAAPSVSWTFFVHHASQTISWSDPPGQIAATTLALTATASSGLPVSYITYTPSICTISTDGSGNPIALMLAYGDCSLQANQAGNATYSAATDVGYTFFVHHAGQTITFPAVGTQTAGNSVLLPATASSGLAVSYASTTPAVCTIDGSGLYAVLGAPGTCTVQASQAGNAAYGAAATVTQSFTVIVLPTS
jgi:hypothetical protein